MGPSFMVPLALPFLCPPAEGKMLGGAVEAGPEERGDWAKVRLAAYMGPSK